MSIIITLIIAAEILFWVFIVLGLVTRYIFHKEKLSVLLLSCTILVDLFLIIAATFNLHQGGTAEITHGIAAVYIAISIVFGKDFINWADEKFKVLYLKETPRPKIYGNQYAKQYLKSFFKHIIAFLIAYGLIYLMLVVANNPSSLNNLMGVIRIWKFILFIDFIITISYFIWPKKEKIDT
ncbi:hypothetical protein [Macrococcus armenti]|uniref:hypothetical protein n=1 Tax=Macrococcus armenti TaxID=2875764 RepID=UPI001CC9F858|nr:hypothetical protein [Macrococcus armenti]UBH08042.1 hypothetical protein LAU41_08395 [Macrococcus armenti]UBH10274.1 hypothetical protein LAU38_08320 [Macrococcus armenti]